MILEWSLICSRVSGIESVLVRASAGLTGDPGLMGTFKLYLPTSVNSSTQDFKLILEHLPHQDIPPPK